jgi:hypothetical protein
MGFGKHRHRDHQSSTDKNNDKQQQQKETTHHTLTHDGMLIVKKEGLRKGGTRNKSGAERKSPNGDYDDATRLLTKKQGLRGGGTPMSTSAIRRTTHSKSSAAANNNNNTASPTPTLVNSDRDDAGASARRRLEKGEASAAAPLRYDNDIGNDNVTNEDIKLLLELAASVRCDNDNANDNEDSKLLLEVAQRERATDARRKEHVIQQLQQYQEGIFCTDYDDETYPHSITQSMSSTSSSSTSSSSTSSMSTSTSDGSSTNGIDFWNEYMALFFLIAADCIEANCSPVALRRKAAANPLTDAANAGQHKHHSSAAASRRSSNRNGTASTRCFNDPPGGSLIFVTGKSRGKGKSRM